MTVILTRDEEEKLAADDLQAYQLDRFSTLAGRIVENAFYKHKFKDLEFDIMDIPSMEQFRQLPFTTKDELSVDQQNNPPYGSNLSFNLTRYCRLHQTSGTSGQPLNWLDTYESWQWFMKCWSNIYRLAEVTPDDKLFFPFSFGPFIGFWAAFEGAMHLGNLTLSGGGMTTRARLQFMLDHTATLVCCTPTYAMRMAHVAEAEGINLADSPVRALIVAGEPGGSVPAVRQQIQEAWGARVFDHSGMTELGSLTMECTSTDCAPHVLENEFIAEILNPETMEPVHDGECGELVVTNLGRFGSPLIRYRTGDRVEQHTEPCPCGRTYMRLRGGVLGREDDMIWIRGNNVYPANIENLIRKHAEVREFLLEISEQSGMSQLSVKLELKSAYLLLAKTVAADISNEIADMFHFRAEVQVVDPGTLPEFEMKARRIIRK